MYLEGTSDFLGTLLHAHEAKPTCLGSPYDVEPGPVIGDSQSRCAACSESDFDIARTAVADRVGDCLANNSHHRFSLCGI
jgi:hypothetical protein